MAFCRNCGAALKDGAQFCSACGAPAAPTAAQQPNPTYASGASADPAAQFDPQDVQQNKVMAILAYFGILVLVPLFVAKGSRFARFHANQGLVLLICESAFTVLYRIISKILLAISSSLSFLTGILGIVYLAFFVLAILGIVSAAGGNAKKLPVIGDFQIVK